MQTRDFLARVVPEGNYLALSVNMTPGTDQTRMMVRMFTGVDDAARFAAWAVKKGWEVFHCQASYRIAEAEDDGRGGTRYKGSKHATNAVRSRALYLDLDVHRPGDKKTPGVNAFASRQDAVAWLAGFIKDTGLPQPSIVVDSGYGFHPYWILDEPLAPADWQVAAHALRAAMVAKGYIGDAGITTDIARILRTPGSVNRKDLANPQEVTVKTAGPPIANITMMTALQPWVVYAASAQQMQNASAGAVVTALNGGPSAAFKATTVGSMASAAQANIPDYAEGRLYRMANIASGCGQVAESLRTGGNGDPYPLWYTGFLTLAAFTTDGVDYIHPLSQGDPRYSTAGVEAAWAKVQAEKAAKQHGPPTCSWFQAHRPAACQGCPHAGQIKSPVVLGRDDSDLPRGYRRSGRGIEMERLDKEGNPEWVLVSPGDITDFNVSMTSDGAQVSFRYRRGQTDTVVRYGQPEMLALSKEKLASFLATKLIHLPSPEHVIRMRGLLVAWLDKMEAEQRLRMEATPAFGWVERSGKIIGYAHAATVYGTDGSESFTSAGDPKVIAKYGMVGDFAPWRTACDFVTAGRPDLTMLVAASFGAPLMRFTGQSGVIVSCISRQSGIGKSSAITVGQAIWGNPVIAINSLYDTMNAVMKKVGETSTLPAYWDELRSGGDTKRFTDLAFALTQGREKARLAADTSARSIGTWQTMLVAAANEPLMEHVIEDVQGSEAGALRIFEVEVTTPPIPPVPGAAMIIAAAKSNYGHVGREYARWLAQNAPRLEAATTTLIDRIVQELGARTEERFYVAAIACILQGAAIANRQGWANFDISSLKLFLFDAFHTLRGGRSQTLVATSTGYDLETIMSEFMSALSHERLVTNIFGDKNTFVNVLLAPLGGRKASVQIAVKDGLVRIQRTALSNVLRAKNISFQAIKRELEEQWGAKIRREPIGVGTPYSVGQTWVVDIPLTVPCLSDYAVVGGTDKSTR